MFTLFIVLHVIFCIFLILVILLQTGKGAGIGAAFGGGSQTVFGPRGAGSFIGKVTGVVAGLFMLTSIVLAFLSTSRSDKVSKAVEALQHIPASAVESVALDEKKETGTDEVAKDSAASPVEETSASADPGGTDVDKKEKEGEDENPSADAPKATEDKIVPAFKNNEIPDLSAGGEKRSKAVKPVGLEKAEKSKPVSGAKPKAEKAEPAASKPKAEKAEPAASKPKAEKAEPAASKPKAEKAEPAASKPKAEKAEPAASKPKAEKAEPASPAAE